jgi:hypothetical protein
MTAILACDLDTATGWALRTSDGQVISGTASFRPGRFEGGGMRFLRFRGWLEELASTCGAPSAVYFEEVRRHAGVDAAHAYGGFLATLTAWCEQRQVPYVGVPVCTIKKHSTGKVNADKAATIDAATRRGLAADEEDETDALTLPAWALKQPMHWMARVAASNPTLTTARATPAAGGHP